MTGYEYEKKCAELLKAKGFSNVTVTPGSGDQGIDVLAKKGKKKYGIQCKYYEGTVGNKAVQEAFAGASFYDCSVAMVITNSKLTEPAKKLAQKLGVEVWEGIDAIYLQKNDAEYIKKQAEKKKKDQERRAAAKEEKKRQTVAEFQQWQESYPSRKAALKKKLEKSDAEYTRRRQELYIPISDLKSEKSRLSVKLETASFFAFAEKSRTRKHLNEIDAEIQKLSDGLEEQLVQLEQEHHFDHQKIRTKARQSYPNLVQESIRASLKTKIGKEYPDYSPDILLALYFSDKQMNIDELNFQLSENGNYLLKLLNPMVENGIITKGYMLNDGTIVRTLEKLSGYFGYYPRAVYTLPNPERFEKLEDEICEELAGYALEEVNATMLKIDVTQENARREKRREEENLKQLIVEYLAGTVSGASTTEIVNEIPSLRLSGCTNQDVSRLMRQLLSAGRIERAEKKGRTVFSLR